MGEDGNENRGKKHSLRNGSCTSRSEENGMSSHTHCRKLTLQSYEQYVRWYIDLKEKQKEFALPIVSPDIFQVKEQAKTAPQQAPQYMNLPKPRVPDAWSSAPRPPPVGK